MIKVIKIILHKKLKKNIVCQIYFLTNFSTSSKVIHSNHIQDLGSICISNESTHHVELLSWNNHRLISPSFFSTFENTFFFFLKYHHFPTTEFFHILSANTPHGDLQLFYYNHPPQTSDFRGRWKRKFFSNFPIFFFIFIGIFKK